MDRRWQFQEAKAKLSEVINTTLRDGPQTITRHGKDAVVMVPAAEYKRQHGRARPMKLSELFRPLAGIKVSRSKDLPRSSPDFGGKGS